ncbi:hypothetical protein AMJ74_00660 [candidate division WOR_3 bacterium SM1_77]|uniref:Methyl-accepting transducer domain-containing protein n=1 Tax=candidate division WOR_3 bacterium SM1_77 TaxID=1703778 RepID=A0A0S8K2E2_UNCW3|nr:MAG: hypothetical protein AMJ74_00660 [candidate division WOR_3 bacterium SM1_77]
MEFLKEEVREKEKNFTIKAATVVMFFCALVEILFVTGRIFNFLLMPVIISIIVAVVFLSGFILYRLCKDNIFSRVMPYIVTTLTVVALTVALGYMNPAFRIPFFLVYFYIILHPAVILGGQYAIFTISIVDMSYFLMILLTRSRYPYIDIQTELIRLLLLTIIALLLTLEFDKNLKRIHEIRKVAGRAEDGDLTGRINEVEEVDDISFLAKSFNRMLQGETNLVRLIIEIVGSLTDMSEQIASTANEMAASSSEIVSTTQRMTEGINEQFNELDKTISTGKTLSEVSFDVVSNVKKVEEFSVGVSDSASNAISQSDVVTNNIELIGKRYSNLTTLMTKMQVISSTINKIVNTIDSIAEKINILSLNASIEAARAGEYGRGFSIVADEVKKLADSSQDSASEIGRIIKEMMESIETVTESTEEVNTAISDGSVVVKSTADSLRDISNKVLELNSAIKNIKEMISKEEDEITNIIQQVESSHGISKENSAAAEEILASIQQQSAATEEFSATSQELVSVSNKLHEMVKRFKVNETD